MARQNNELQSATNEFIISGLPWVSASTATGVSQITWTDARISGGPTYVSQWVVIKNTGTSGTLGVSFTQAGMTSGNKFTISAGSSFEKPLACTGLFVSGSAAQPFEIICGLTNVSASRFYTISSSNDNPGVG